MRYFSISAEYNKTIGVYTLTAKILFSETLMSAELTYTFTEDNGKGRANLTITEDIGRKYPLKRSITTGDKNKLVSFIEQYNNRLLNEPLIVKNDWLTFDNCSQNEGNDLGGRVAKVFETIKNKNHLMVL